MSDTKMDRKDRAARHLAIINSAVDFAIIATDRDGSVTEWNTGAERILGWTAEEMSGNSVDRFFTPEDRAAGRPQEEMRLSLKRGRASDERWHMRKDGSRFWASGEMMPLKDEADRPLGFVKILRDRTSERRDSLALVESEGRYRALFDAVNDGFCVIEFIDGPHGPSSDYVHVEANAGYQRQTGIADIVGKTLREIAPIGADAWAELYGSVLRTGDAIRFEREFVEVGRHIEVSASRIEPASLRQVAVLFRDVTERKRAEAELRGLNATLEQQVTERTAERDRIWANSRDMLGVADDRGVWVSVSPAWTRILGWQADEIVGQTSEWMEHPDDRERTRAEIHRLAAGATTFEFENRFRAHDGRYRTLSWSAVAENGLLYCVARDVTETRAHEALVAEQAAAAERTWNFSPDLLSVIDLNSGAFERVNPAWMTALGWAAEEIEGRSYGAFVHPGDAGESSAAFEKVRKGDPVLRFENRYRHRDGSWRWLSWVAFPQGDKLYSSSRDVTEDKQRASALRLFENIVESASAPICAFDNEFRLIAFNKAHSDEFFRIFATRVKLGDVFPDLFPPDQAPIMRGFMARALAGEVYTITEEFGDPSLAKPYWEVSYSPIRNEQGVIIGAFHYAQDISQRLRAQAELEATQEALRQSQKTEAIGQLTGGVAHDFNNLLTVIRGSIDLMRRGTLPEERRQRHMQAISDTVTRATRLTSQLLAFARRQSLQPEVIDVGKSMRTISEMLATLSGSRIEIIPHAPTEPCFVNVDPNQFDTALVNMAVNARDAMDGEGTLTIRVRPLERMPAMRSHPAMEGSFVAVSLEDTGSGIPEEQIEHIFEPFFTTKAVGAGTGLGLSQVFGFAKQSGGEVMVESTVGKGTTFTLYLPRVAAPAEMLEPAVPEEVVPGDGACVLLVEDNEEVGSFAAQALADLGYVAVWALNAAEALRRLDEDADRFDVVFSDVIMPGMNGIDLAQAIRRDYPGLPVVLTSGYSSVLAQGGTHGFELLHKPYSVEQMSRALGKVAARRRRSVSEPHTVSG